MATVLPNRKLLGIVAIALVTGILVTGLWPFNFFAANNVSWNSAARSLHFQPYGIAYSTMDVALQGGAATPDSESASIEVKFRAAANRRRHYSVVAAIGEDTSRPMIALAQAGPDLEIGVSCTECPDGVRKMWVDNVLGKPDDRIVTVVTGTAGTDIFVDGSYTLHRPRLSISPAHVRGRLVLGNSADGSFPWTGDLFGLAIYSRALSASEQAEHARYWSTGTTQKLAASPKIAALYIFDQQPEGTVIHDRTGSNIDISIPSKFHPVRRVLLRRYSVRALDWPDIFLNFLGFIPFGIVLFAYFQAASPGPRRHGAVLAFVASIGISVCVEVMQRYLPSRDPSLIDVTTNAIGAAVGILCSYLILRRCRIAGIPAA
jgi:VanZ family protein